MPNAPVVDSFGQVILEASFEGVQFPVADVEVQDGHDIIPHVAYQRPGADIEPTGPKARSGKLTIPMLNDIGYGTLFPGRYLELRQKIRDNPLGEFTHPLEGNMVASLHTVSIQASADNRSGVMMTIEWLEHNDTATPNLALFSGDEDAPTVAEQHATDADSLVDEVLNGQRP